MLTLINGVLRLPLLSAVAEARLVSQVGPPVLVAAEIRV
jgi:hypothetical protein